MTSMEQQSEDEAYKFGIQYEPPSLVYVYRDKHTHKLRRFMMPIRNFDVRSDYKAVAEDIKNRHDEKLKPISLDKIEAALRLLMDRMKGDDSKNVQNRRLFRITPGKCSEDSLTSEMNKMNVFNDQNESAISKSDDLTQ